MFIESPRFPSKISYGSSGGPVYNTTVRPTLSGRNKKNINWQYPLHDYNVGYGIRSSEDIEEVLYFLHVCRGRAHQFRYKDFADFKSCRINDEVSFTDQVIGIGDGVKVEFQLVKNYIIGPESQQRIISKTVSSTELFGIDGVLTPPLSIDSTTGLVTFSSAPASGLQVTSGYEFDVPCSFQRDDLNSNFENFSSSSVDVRVGEERQ